MKIIEYMNDYRGKTSIEIDLHKTSPSKSLLVGLSEKYEDDTFYFVKNRADNTLEGPYYFLYGRGHIESIINETFEDRIDVSKLEYQLSEQEQ